MIIIMSYGRTSHGSLREYDGRLRYRLRKKIGRTRASAARGCALGVRECGTSGHAAAH